MIYQKCSATGMINILRFRCGTQQVRKDTVVSQLHTIMGLQASLSCLISPALTPSQPYEDGKIYVLFIMVGL